MKPHRKLFELASDPPAFFKHLGESNGVLQFPTSSAPFLQSPLTLAPPPPQYPEDIKIGEFIRLRNQCLPLLKFCSPEVEAPHMGLLGIGDTGSVWLTPGPKVYKVFQRPSSDQLAHEIVTSQYLNAKFPNNVIGYESSTVMEDGVTSVSEMRRLQGRDLFYACVGQLVSMVDIYDWMEELVGVTKKLHEHGLLLRDIKPENIFVLTKDRNPKMPRLRFIDLSTVCFKDDDVMMAQRVGTEEYCHPRMLTDHCAYSHTTDVYSLLLTFIVMVVDDLPDMKCSTIVNCDRLRSMCPSLHQFFVRHLLFAERTPHLEYPDDWQQELLECIQYDRWRLSGQDTASTPEASCCKRRA